MIIKDKNILQDFEIHVKFKECQVYEDVGDGKKTHHIKVKTVQEALTFIIEQLIARSEKEVTLGEFTQITSSLQQAIVDSTTPKTAS